MAQEGDDEKGIDTMDGVKSNFGDWRCVFAPASDSLYMMMKNSKSKRAFINTFSKSTLLEMELKQSVEKIVNLLLEAKSGKKEELTFKVAYGDKENSNKVSYDTLSKDYVKGYALYVFVIIDSSYFNAEYTFKLLEQERNELDILRDMVEDMQEQMEEMKSNSKPGIAAWWTQGAAGTNGDLLSLK